MKLDYRIVLFFAFFLLLCGAIGLLITGVL
jgi:hypothetical protein